MCSLSSEVYQSGNVGERREETDFRWRGSEYRQSSHQVLEEAAGWDVGWRCCITASLSKWKWSASCCSTDGSEEKKKDGSPVRSSSTSKDSGSSEKRFASYRGHHNPVIQHWCWRSWFPPLSSSIKTSDESPSAPTSPGLPPTVPSFPPAPITTGNVRSKCRELLVAALQTGGEPIICLLICAPLLPLKPDWFVLDSPVPVYCNSYWDCNTGAPLVHIWERVIGTCTFSSSCFGISTGYLDVAYFSCTFTTTWEGPNIGEATPEDPTKAATKPPMSLKGFWSTGSASSEDCFWGAGFCSRLRIKGIHVCFYVKSPISGSMCFAGDHLTMGVNCQHLATQIEEDILWPMAALTWCCLVFSDWTLVDVLRVLRCSRCFSSLT